MSIEENVQIVKDFFAAMGGSNKRDLLALVAEDVEWIIPGEDWPLAGSHRGHAELADVLQKASEEVEMKYPKPPEFVAQGDRVRAGVDSGSAVDRPLAGRALVECPNVKEIRSRCTTNPNYPS